MDKLLKFNYRKARITIKKNWAKDPNRKPYQRRDTEGK